MPSGTSGWIWAIFWTSKSLIRCRIYAIALMTLLGSRLRMGITHLVICLVAGLCFQVTILGGFCITGAPKTLSRTMVNWSCSLSSVFGKSLPFSLQTRTSTCKNSWNPPPLHHFTLGYQKLSSWKQTTESVSIPWTVVFQEELPARMFSDQGKSTQSE